MAEPNLRDEKTPVDKLFSKGTFEVFGLAYSNQLLGAIRASLHNAGCDKLLDLKKLKIFLNGYGRCLCNESGPLPNVGQAYTAVVEKVLGKIGIVLQTTTGRNK